MIDLRDHATEIKRAFRNTPFRHCGFKVHPDHFEFTTPHSLTATDSRLMGKAIAASATTLAAVAVKVYEAAPDSKRNTSKQIFKRRIDAP
ncbi:hypothetical protein K8353_24305 [Burkholderia contaminans]|nr:hypothetical protein [Burkholderia contaminans]